MTTIAFGGDTMLGRLVAERIAERGPGVIWGNILRDLWSADLLCVNLECALTTRTERWLDGQRKAFYFGAHPRAVEALHIAGVDLVSLANNHVLDFREAGLRETVATLDAAGIAHAGAGSDLAAAACPGRIDADGLRVAVVAFTDHPDEWAAGLASAGTNHLRISSGADHPAVVRRALAAAREGADLVVLSLHWGPNMRERPSREFRELARAAVESGADVVWGHSAHVVQGIEFHRGRPILYDTGELVDDYAVDPHLRNDLGALFLLRVRTGSIEEVSLVPLRIADMRVSLLEGTEREWLVDRVRRLCAELGTEVVMADKRIVARAPIGAPSH
jgi:poly-gamma-glutamate capsule biosynthesis protein CapA/YwtB (metallophosphatase superfamily)